MKRTVAKQTLILCKRVSLLLGVPAFAFLISFTPLVHAAQLTNRSVKMSNSAAAASNVTYELKFDRPGGGLLGSLQFEVCSNDPFPGTPCTVPAGFDFSTAVIASQTGVSGFSISGLSTANNLILSRAPSVVAPSTITIVINGIKNPDNSGTYFVRLQTFATNNASGAADDQAGLAIAYTRNFGVSTEVPPFLFFCVASTLPGFTCSSTDSFVDLGEFSTNSHTVATSQMIVATNAQYGVNIYVSGATLTSGNNEIPPLATNAGPQTSTSQFGINLRNNPAVGTGSDPVGPGTTTAAAGYDQPNSFRFVSGEVIAHSSGSSDYTKLTVSYLVDISKSQKPGIYNSTIIYTALASF